MADGEDQPEGRRRRHRRQQQRSKRTLALRPYRPPPAWTGCNRPHCNREDIRRRVRAARGKAVPTVLCKALVSKNDLAGRDLFRCFYNEKQAWICAES